MIVLSETTRCIPADITTLKSVLSQKEGLKWKNIVPLRIAMSLLLFIVWRCKSCC